MLYAVIMRFDSLREITASLLAETRKLAHPGITFRIGRSTLADANKRRTEAIFEAIYRDLYATYRMMYYVDFLSLFNNPEKEWEIILSEASGAPPEPSLFD